MIQENLDPVHSILYVHPRAPLEKNDFVELSKVVDPYIEKRGGLSGIVIDAPTFPGWDSLGAMAAHFRFAHDHQKHVKKIALVTDSVLGSVAQHLASHFVSAEIKHFSASELEPAKRWIMKPL